MNTYWEMVDIFENTKTKLKWQNLQSFTLTNIFNTGVFIIVNYLNFYRFPQLAVRK
jgi:hypothetical protein